MINAVIHCLTNTSANDILDSADYHKAVILQFNWMTNQISAD